MKNILQYTKFINEMWDTIPDINVINRISARDEDITYEFEIDGAIYPILRPQKKRPKPLIFFYINLFLNPSKLLSSKSTSCSTEHSRNKP